MRPVDRAICIRRAEDNRVQTSLTGHPWLHTGVHRKRGHPPPHVAEHPTCQLHRMPQTPGLKRTDDDHTKPIESLPALGAIDVSRALMAQDSPHRPRPRFLLRVIPSEQKQSRAAIVILMIASHGGPCPRLTPMSAAKPPADGADRNVACVRRIVTSSRGRHSRSFARETPALHTPTVRTSPIWAARAGVSRAPFGSNARVVPHVSPPHPWGCRFAWVPVVSPISQPCRRCAKGAGGLAAERDALRRRSATATSGRHFRFCRRVECRSLARDTDGI